MSALTETVLATCDLIEDHGLRPRLRGLYEVTRCQDCFCLLGGVTSASECPSITSQICSPVVDVVTHSVTTGLW